MIELDGFSSVASMTNSDLFGRSTNNQPQAVPVANGGHDTVINLETTMVSPSQMSTRLICTVAISLFTRRCRWRNNFVRGYSGQETFSVERSLGSFRPTVRGDVGRWAALGNERPDFFGKCHSLLGHG